MIEVRKNQMHMKSPLEKVLVEACEKISLRKRKPKWKRWQKQLENIQEVSIIFEEEKLVKREANDKIQLELKLLLTHLKYVFLEEGVKKSLIINSSLLNTEEQKLAILKANQEAIRWHISFERDKSNILHAQDNVRLRLQTYCTITMKIESNHEGGGEKRGYTSAEVGMIYPISNSAWVSIMHVVPKKRRIDCYSWW